MLLAKALDPGGIKRNERMNLVTAFGNSHAIFHAYVETGQDAAFYLDYIDGN